jgi:hypothetical protein
VGDGSQVAGCGVAVLVDEGVHRGGGEFDQIRGKATAAIRGVPNDWGLDASARFTVRGSAVRMQALAATIRMAVAST